MVGSLLLVFVTGLELLCWAVGYDLGETGAAPGVRSLWQTALAFIPLAGIGAVWVLSRPHPVPPNRRLGAVAGLFGLGGAIYWWVQAVVNRGEFQRYAGAQIAAMALTAALLLLGAGLSHLVSGQRVNAP